MILRDLVEPEATLLAIPSGGVPVAMPIARELSLSLDVVVVRKIQIPGNEEAGFGAVGPDGKVLFHDRIVDDLKLTTKEIKSQVNKTQRVLKRREEKFRRGKPQPVLKDRQVVLVDDGLATGYTMLAAVEFVRHQEARQVIVASPTASQRTVNLLMSQADALVVLNIRGGPVFAVADAFEEWHDLSDDEVIRLLKEVEAGRTNSVQRE